MKSAEDVAEFERLVAAHFQVKGMNVSVEDGSVTLIDPSDDPGGLSPEFGLANLAAACALSPKEEWHALIDRHFDRIDRILSESEQFLDNLQDYAWAESRLGVWLNTPEYFAPEYQSRIAESHYVREDLDGLLTTLVIFDDGRVITVNRADTGSWPSDEDTLFHRAFENVQEWTSSVTDRYRHELDDGTVYLTLYGKSPFVASLALLLDTSSPPLSELGLIVSVPTRDSVLALQVTESLTTGSLGLFEDLAYADYSEGPGSISPALYWVRRGEAVRVEITRNDSGGVQVRSPDELARLTSP